jgi:hypothetical protein
VETDCSGKVGYSNRRVTTQSDLGLTNPQIISRDDEIAHHGQFGASAERMSMNRSDADAIRFTHPENELMELFQRGLDPARCMIRDIDAGGEGLAAGS